MRTKAAVIRGIGRPWEVLELDLDRPQAHEALVRFAAAGLCHSDDHLRHMPSGHLPVRYPMVGGHEGAGVVEQVGEAVTRVRPGDRVMCSSIPACGACAWCMQGHENLCDMGANGLNGSLPTPAGGFRFHHDGEDLGAMSFVGSFSEYSVIPEYSLVRINEPVPLDVAVLIGCSVATGWGAAVKAAQVAAGDTAVIYGVGGIGMNAVQGCRYTGARHIVAVDPVAGKRRTAEELGATHSCGNADEAHQLIRSLTDGRMAQHAIVTVAILDPEIVSAAFDVVGKNGTVTLVGIGDPTAKTVQLNGTMLVLQQKRVLGTLFGGINPRTGLTELLGLYRSGHILLDQLITARYRLEDINEGYDDLLAGRNIRGIVVYDG